jgi:hypothetical protein
VVQFQLTGDRCHNLDGLNVGDMVRVEFSLRGREWRSPSGEVKYFNSLDVWTIEAVGGQKQANKSNGAPPAQPQSAGTESGEVDDGIPFLSCDMSHEPSPLARVIR